MKICIVNEGFEMGGVEKVTIQLANSLQEKGHDLFLIDFSGKNETFYQVNREVKKNNIIKQRTVRRKIIGKIIKIKYCIEKKSINILNLYKEQTFDLINFLDKTNCDVLIVNQGVLTALIPIIKNKIPRLKIIAWQHNEYEVYINKYSTNYINDYLSGVKLADSVICLTQADQQKFVNLNKQSKYIYNPLTIKEVNKISNINSKNIIFVGRLKLEQKGLDYLIKIGEKITGDWKIIIAGDGPDKKKFLNMIKENKLENKIILKGTLNNEELVDFYLSGAVFISTSRWEGFGLVITEAMSFGLPIISFNNNGPTEILNNGEYGVLIEKNNIDEFVVKLIELLNNPIKRMYFQKKSLRRVVDFRKENIVCTWDRYLKNL
ncbi:glycosyltransferase [Bacillus sp. SJS]|uniref:glycosyltransferase n=1 Tax=Bacillus sp. SJS TaxID=1423321 RepID=UPI00068EAAC9|nr:glycosyltransferase [Bacillus sp. SJS]KZZ83904.1 hypothetical protein AS29_014235 [Bacillus sp. SJS]